MILKLKWKFSQAKSGSEHDNGDGDTGVQLGWSFNLRLVFSIGGSLTFWGLVGGRAY